MDCSAEVAIIGAGPYGLSLAAYLSAAGVTTRIYGRPMDSWLRHMPKGMLLKSDPFASNLADPGDFYTLARFCAERSIPYSESEPVALSTFCDYGVAFQKRCVPELQEAHVAAVRRDAEGFVLELENGDTSRARRVVAAIGIGHFRSIPDCLNRVGKPYVSHSFDHHDLSPFAGARVAVIGGGASAIDLAGLLAEQGCDVHLATRRSSLKFSGVARGGGRRSLWSRIRHPSSGLGPGLRSRFCTDAPLVFHALPQRLRFEFVRRHLGPSAAGVMKEKVIGRLPVLYDRELVGAEVENGRVALSLKHKDGRAEQLLVDHVIAATGFQTAVGRLDFLSSSLQAEIVTFRGAPVLSASFESSAPGLYFIGPAAAVSFGPMMRFTFGARYVARRLTRALARAQSASAKTSVVPMALGAPAEDRPL